MRKMHAAGTMQAALDRVMKGFFYGHLGATDRGLDVYSVAHMGSM